MNLYFVKELITSAVGSETITLDGTLFIIISFSPIIPTQLYLA